MTYYLELKNNILKAITKANIKVPKLKENYKDNLIDILTLEKACDLNLKDKFCNVGLQYTWFCLNKEDVYRKFSNGWRKIKVSFSDTCVDNSKKNRKIVSKAYDLCPKPKSKIFSNICEKSYVSIREYISGKTKIPLSVFLKSCQLLDKDPWKELDKCKLYSGSSERSKFIIFEDKITPELYILLNWIKLEGTLPINHPSISISQNFQEVLCLEKLKKYFQEVFSIPKESIKICIFKSRSNLLDLFISSAPLRQILNLRYDIPLGYKSRKIKPNPTFNFKKEDILKILSSEIETEGSFARHKKYNITHCDVSFSTYSKDYSYYLFSKLKKLGYPVSFRISKRERKGIKEVEYKVVFWGCFEIQKFAFEIMPYFHHLGKTNKLIEVIKQENYLKTTRIKFNSNIQKLIYKTKDKCGNFKLLSERLNKENMKVSKEAVEGWAHQSLKIPVYAIIKMCLIIGEKDYFKFIPKELALSLWLNGFIERKKAEDLRGIKNAYKHIKFK